MRRIYMTSRLQLSVRSKEASIQGYNEDRRGRKFVKLDEVEYRVRIRHGRKGTGTRATRATSKTRRLKSEEGIAHLKRRARLIQQPLDNNFQILL